MSAAAILALFSRFSYSRPQMAEPLHLTVVCPVYNEEHTIPLFYERTRKVLEALASNYSWSILFIDNDSHDKSQEIIRNICEKDRHVYRIALTRNFGYQSSVECGLRNAQGNLIVVIDVDCEDPPEMIPDFLRLHAQGYDVVYGERLDRIENPLLKLGRKIFYRFTRAVADEHFNLDMAEFCLITSEVRDAIVQDNNSFPFIRASIGRIGFNQKNLPYKRQRRIAGKTHYSLMRMTIFAVAGILSSSTIILRLPAYALPFWLLFMLVFPMLGHCLGWTWYLPATLSVGFGFCGFVLAGMSIYMARVYKNGLNRPNFIINKKKSRMEPLTQNASTALPQARAGS